MKSTIWTEHENELIAHHGRYRIVLILKGIKGFVAGILSVEYKRAHILITSTAPQVLVNQNSEAPRIRKLFYKTFSNTLKILYYQKEI